MPRPRNSTAARAVSIWQTNRTSDPLTASARASAAQRSRLRLPSGADASSRNAIFTKPTAPQECCERPAGRPPDLRSSPSGLSAIQTTPCPGSPWEGAITPHHNLRRLQNNAILACPLTSPPKICRRRPRMRPTGPVQPATRSDGARPTYPPPRAHPGPRFASAGSGPTVILGGREASTQVVGLTRCSRCCRTRV